MENIMSRRMRPFPIKRISTATVRSTELRIAFVTILYIISMPFLVFHGSFESPPLVYGNFTNDVADWMIKTNFSNKNKCKLCNFQPNPDGTVPNSSENDVVLTISFGNFTNLHLFVRSLRTTGCKARIVVLTDSSALKKYPPVFFELLDDCNVQFINFGEIKPPDKFGIFFFRYHLYLKFITINEGQIDRMIVADMFDTVFQHDPFITLFDGKHFFLTNELMLIKDHPWYTGLMRDGIKKLKLLNPPEYMSNRLYNQILKKPIINGGIQAGTPDKMLKYYTYMTRIGNAATLEAYGDDQMFMNYFLYLHKFDDSINFMIDPCNQSFLASAINYVKTNVSAWNFTKFGRFDIHGRIPALLHQFDRSQAAVNNIVEACPNEDPPLDDYSRWLPE